MEIGLTHGRVALVDDDDQEMVKDYHWFAHSGRAGKQYVSGYSRGMSDRARVQLSRLLLDAPRGMEVDHINGNTLDNRRQNLRLCTHAQNGANRRVQQRKSCGRFKGVWFRKGIGKWEACVRANGKNGYLGLFESEIDAALAYNVAARSLFGEFARLNEVNP